VVVITESTTEVSMPFSFEKPLTNAGSYMILGRHRKTLRLELDAGVLRIKVDSKPEIRYVQITLSIKVCGRIFSSFTW
jgi:hypothetical protein